MSSKISESCAIDALARHGVGVAPALAAQPEAARMQPVGRPFAEGTLLRLGHAVQRATDWHRREPGL